MKEYFSSVLLIEDEAAHAELITRSLRGLVGEVIHVSRGDEGVKALEERFVDLVFCDLHLPDMTALDILSQVRLARPGLTFVVLTSSNDIDSAMNAMRGGASDFMVKNFSSAFSSRLEFTLGRLAAEEARRLRELELRSERDAFWTAAHSSNDGLAILTSSGQVVFENHSFQLFRKAISEESELSDIVQLISGVSPSIAEALDGQLKSESSNVLWRGEISFSVESQGKPVTRYFELNLSSVAFSGPDSLSFSSEALQDFKRIILWAKDITSRKDRERMNRDLLATTTHDLKGPLGAIINSVDLIAQMIDVPDEKAAGLLTRISSCARGCINLIDELLSARRIQDGVFVIRPRELELKEEIEDIVLDYLPMAKARGISFGGYVLGDPKIYADALSLRRVLGNLVSNALKFTPAGGRVELSVEVDDSEVRILCSDTGPGIDPKVQPTLFEKYGRLDRDEQIDGSGLGLFVTKNIVDAHGGKIEIKSSGETGTTFIVSFPHVKRAPIGS